MPTLQESREKRANIWSQMSEIMTRTGSNPGGEDAATYDRLENELDEIGDQIERAERHADAERRIAAVDRTGVVANSTGDRDGDHEQAYAAAFDRYIRAAQGFAELEDQDRRLVRSGFVSNDQIKMAAGTTGTAGGYTIPPVFRDTMIETLLAYGPMLQLAERLDTESGANLPWPTNDDTGNEGAILAENTQITEQDVTLGTASLDAYMYTSKLVRASWQLMQDAPDFAGWLARKLGERLGRIYNRHATTGTGTAQPDGIVTSATVGVTGTGSFASTGGVSYVNLVDLVESLDDAYLQGLGQARFMGHQTVRRQMRRLLDSQNRPIWEPSIQAGTPDTILGYPFTVNNHMATLAASSKSLLFGDIRQAYVIRIVRENQLVRLNERYADYLQTGFFAFGRMDGTLQNAGAVRVFTTTSTA